MSRLSEVVPKIRSKNAGPFWLTLDLFCETPDVFQRVAKGLASEDVARALGAAPDALKRFDIAELNVVKFSLPRPAIQGVSADRDMHGASFAILLYDLEID